MIIFFCFSRLFRVLFYSLEYLTLFSWQFVRQKCHSHLISISPICYSFDAKTKRKFTFSCNFHSIAFSLHEKPVKRPEMENRKQHEKKIFISMFRGFHSEKFEILAFLSKHTTNWHDDCINTNDFSSASSVLLFRWFSYKIQSREVG